MTDKTPHISLEPKSLEEVMHHALNIAHTCGGATISRKMGARTQHFKITPIK